MKLIQEKFVHKVQLNTLFEIQERNKDIFVDLKSEKERRKE